MPRMFVLNILTPKKTVFYQWHILSLEEFHCSIARTCNWPAFSLSRRLSWFPWLINVCWISVSDCNWGVKPGTWEFSSSRGWITTESSAKWCETHLSESSCSFGTAQTTVLRVTFPLLLPNRNMWFLEAEFLALSLEGRCIKFW